MQQHDDEAKQPEDWTAYAQYQWFKDFDRSLLQDVQWDTLLRSTDVMEQGAFWFGSQGARTQCHYDSYGTNMVAQHYGLKHWILLPPLATDSLRPTRLPYEESTVWSSCNLRNGSSDSLLAAGGAQQVTLRPGDVLHVPHQWWHDVICLSTAVSTNVWEPHPQDEKQRGLEALVCLAALLLRVGHVACINYSCCDFLDGFNDCSGSFKPGRCSQPCSWMA